jgi:hypothetical protein
MASDGNRLLGAAKELIGLGKLPRGLRQEERWKDYVDLLPGFSAMDEETAYAVYKNTTDIDYKPAKRVTYKGDPGDRHIGNIEICHGVGFIEISSDDGVILLSKELQKAFLYQRSNGNRQRLNAVTAALMEAAGWKGHIQDRGFLEQDQNPPYYELGLEIEQEHRAAREAEYNAIGAYEERPYFVEELRFYYGWRQTLHFEAARAGRLSKSDENLRGLELDSSNVCSYIGVYLEEFRKLGNRKIVSAKARDTQYETVFQNLSALLEAKGKKVIPFKRRYSSSAPVQAPQETLPAAEEMKVSEGGAPAETDIAVATTSAPTEEGAAQIEPAQPIKRLTNLDYALHYVQEQLGIQEGLVQQQQDRMKQGVLTLPNGHYEVFQQYLEAYKALKFLRQHGIEWVGYGADIAKEKLLSNIHKIKTEVERNPQAIPPADTLEFYTHLQEIVDRDVDSLPSALASEAQTIGLPVAEELRADVPSPSQPLDIADGVPVSADTAAAHQPIDDRGTPDLTTSPAADDTIAPVQNSGLPNGSPSLPDTVTDLDDVHRQATDNGDAQESNATTGIAPDNSTVTQVFGPPDANPVPAAQRNSRAALIVGKVVNWAKENAPALLVGSASGATVRIGAHFALAAMATTIPGFAVAVAAAPVAATIVSAVAVGALAGGTSKLIVTSVFGGEKKQQPNWRRKAFIQGAAYGAVGGAVGLGIADFFKADGLLHGLFHGHPVPAGELPHVEPAATPESVVPPHVEPPHVEPAATPESVVPPHVEPPHVEPAATPESVVPPHVEPPHVEPAAPPESVVPPHVEPPHVERAAPSESVVPPHVEPPHVELPVHHDVSKLMSDQMFKQLSPDIQGLAASEKPQDILHFCKEASFQIMNGHHRNAESLQAGAHLIEHALQVAEKAGLHTHAVQQLHADEAYIKAWGIGTDKNVPEALRHARFAGHAVHNYGGKLLKLFGKLTNG